jgi:hypothetical protein
MTIPTLLYGSECRTLAKRQKSRLEAAEMSFSSLNVFDDGAVLLFF